MTTQTRPESVTVSPRQRLLYSAVAVVVIIGVIFGVSLYLFGGGALPPHAHRFSRVGRGPDATTLISTLVVIYTFFAAAYGALVPSLIGKKGRAALVALVFIFLAVLLDLARVWNSTGDLYATTMRNLPAVKVYDATSEFTRYLIVNACVLLFVLVVAFLPAERSRRTWFRLKSKLGATTSPEQPQEPVKTGGSPNQGGMRPPGHEPRTAD
jgi:hypothetical protein